VNEPYTIGIDVGGTKILAIAMGDGVTPLSSAHAPTPDDPDTLKAEVVRRAAEVVEQMGAPPLAVGLGIPGFIDRSGVARQAPNLKAAIGVDLGAPLRERLGVPVLIDNDGNCTALAAQAADAPEGDVVLAVTFGTGIGGGFIVRGSVLHGAHGFAAEPGHMVVKAGGLECVCGQHGCWEMYASGNGLGRLARAAAERGDAPAVLAAAEGELDHVDAKVVSSVARAGDRGAIAVMEEYAGWIAIGLVNLINLFDPDAIVLGGGVVTDHDLFMEGVRAAVRGAALTAGERDTPLVVSSLGPEAGAVGAAILGRAAMGSEPEGARR
jgi:glucokinase